jgi:hypothetical protein
MSFLCGCVHGHVQNLNDQFWDVFHFFSSVILAFKTWDQKKASCSQHAPKGSMLYSFGEGGGVGFVLFFMCSHFVGFVLQLTEALWELLLR